MKRKNSESGSMSVAKERSGQKSDSMDKRIALLGIPSEQMTEPVTLAISALYEKLDDISHELSVARKDFVELEQLVDVDCLAPVPNRRAFMRRLTWAIAMHERYDHPCSLLYFDLNGFKQLNDSYGHAAGDMAIRHVSQIILDSLRQSDFMARIGGDEFAIIMYFSQASDAKLRGEKIAGKIERSSFVWDSETLRVTASFGVYEVQKDDNAETALSGADKAMYKDKKLYKERFVHDAPEHSA